ncbi:hypothetical protein AB6A40_004289 [Gnathostoma spinigerum]|uniref:Complex 1 LYR protein domain-containing protein n=1 Tax=Gnathostoma spinigerum TaxID=75299 RepID=A0ABD6EMR9_9BILA
MAAISRTVWTKLYKDLHRTACQFPQYEYREFFKRRIRELFKDTITKKTQTPQQFYKECQELLVVLDRQSTLSKKFHYTKLVVEK